jgi:mono/diheme cytochrome c family protein
VVLLAADCGPKIGGREPPALYAEFCAECHGADGRGDPEKVERNPDLDLTGTDRTAAGARADVRERIASGHGSMPAFAKKLSAEELEGLVDLVLSLGIEDAAEPR